MRGPVPGCPPGWFGLGCRHRCNCSNGGRCDAATGDCSCGLGWTGARCDEGATETRFVDLFLVGCHVIDLLWFVVLSQNVLQACLVPTASSNATVGTTALVTE